MLKGLHFKLCEVFPFSLLHNDENNYSYLNVSLLSILLVGAMGVALMRILLRGITNKLKPNTGRIRRLLNHSNVYQEARTKTKPQYLASDMDIYEAEKKDIKTHFSDKNNILKDLNLSDVPTKRLPKVIIIGVKKAGTRALLEYLRLHPKVEVADRKPHFFDKNYDNGLNWYRELMPPTYSDQITLEKTASYFATEKAPGRIHRMDPNVKLLLVVRNPVTRLISDYCQTACKNHVPTFEEMAMKDQSLGIVNSSWDPIQTGIYSKNVKIWLQIFSLGQIHLVDGEKLITEPAKEMAKVEDFLGLPRFINENHFVLKAFKGKFPCINVNGEPQALNTINKGRDHPKVDEKVLQRLRDFYRPLNAEFYELVGKNFGWL